jgi:hypothetical protein
MRRADHSARYRISRRGWFTLTLLWLGIAWALAVGAEHVMFWWVK